MGDGPVHILPYDPKWHELFAIYYTLRFYIPYVSLLAQPVNITWYGPGLDCLVFDSVPERYLHYMLDKKYNIANSWCHFGSYGSIWTGPYTAIWPSVPWTICIALHCIALHCIVLYCIISYCIALVGIVFHCMILFCIVLYCIVLHCTSLFSIALFLNYIVLHCFVFNYCEFESRSWRVALYTTLCEIICQWLAIISRWFSPVTPILPPIKLTATIQLNYCWKWRQTPKP